MLQSGLVPSVLSIMIHSFENMIDLCAVLFQSPRDALQVAKLQADGSFTARLPERIYCEWECDRKYHV